MFETSTDHRAAAWVQLGPLIRVLYRMNVNQSDLVKARTDLGSVGGGEFVCGCLGGVLGVGVLEGVVLCYM